MPGVPITEGRDTMDAASLVGTWRMVGYHNRTEDGRELPQSYGPEFMGLFQFHPNGRVMLVIADGRRDLPSNVTRRPFSAYTGTWTFDGVTVSNQVDESFIAEFVGTTLVRHAVYANGRLSLFPPPITIDGIVNHRELIWEKIL
jgi:hypothetical protein